MYTRVHLYDAQRTATREKYSSIALRHLGGELNERDMAVGVVRVLAVLGYAFVYKIQSSHVTSVCVLRIQWEAKIKSRPLKTVNHIATWWKLNVTSAT